MNNVWEPYLGYIVKVCTYSFEFYVDQVSHLKKLEKVFERLDESEFILNIKKIKIKKLKNNLNVWLVISF